MARKARRIQRAASVHRAFQRAAMVVFPLVATALLFLPQSVTDRARVWAGPVFTPLQNLTQGWTLDIAERIRHEDAAGPNDPAHLHDQVKTLENALAEATALLSAYDRQVRDLAAIRQGLNRLPCRLVPGRLLAPEVSGGRSGAMLSRGLDKGIRPGAGVVHRHFDRGAREAIERGEPVLTAAGLVGLVDRVGPVTSTVRLLTDPQANLMVQIITRRGDKWLAGPEAVARGSGDGATLAVTGVPRTSDVAPGDFVVTSPSPESPLPPYLIVGRVVRCDLEPTDLFYDVVVEPRVVAADAREVYVLSPEQGTGQ